jgi:hypothetical protein
VAAMASSSSVVIPLPFSATGDSGIGSFMRADYTSRSPRHNPTSLTLVQAT